MFCEKCGGKLIEKKKRLVCQTCGAKFSLDYSICYFEGNKKEETAESPSSTRFSFKGNVLVIVIAAVLALGIGGTAIGIGISTMPSNRAARYMGAAERYLGEMNYEQAIIEFERLLKIDPMNEDAIIGLADAYASIGNREKAIEVLNNGFELTGARRIERRLNKLQEPTTSSSAENSNDSSSQPVQSSVPSSAGSSKPPVQSNPIVSIGLKYLDVSGYFNSSDILNSVAKGQIITVSKNDEYNNAFPYKSVFLSGDSHITELDAVFTLGIYCTEEKYLVGNDKPNLVHNSGTQHVYKATSNGTELIKTSPYPMYVTQDGYIAYYAMRSSSSVTVNIQSPSGKIVSSTKIDGYSDPVGWAYGVVVDRLLVSNSLFYFVDTKGAPFVYHLYTDQVRNAVTGYYDTKYIRYLFYKTGEVTLDEIIVTSTVRSYDRSYYPEKFSYSGKTYLLAFNNVTYLKNNVVIVEYYESNHHPIDGMDEDYIEPEYAAFVLVNTENGKYSQLYKELSYAENDLFIATDFDGQKCYLNKNGQEISSKYADIGSFGGEYSFVLENGTYYLINKNFEKFMKIDGADVRTVGDNMFSCVKGGKLHLVRVR